jgi:hypothetical protein
LAGGTNQNITLTPSGTGQVVFEKRVVMSTGQGGTAGAPAYSFVDAGAYGLYYVGGTAVGISAAGTQTLTCFGSGVTFLGPSAVDSGNGRLQLATHTTSAGGIGFGTDTSFYRSAAGTLTIQGTTNTILQFAEGASASVRIQQSSGACYIDTQSAQPIILRTNNTTALTLDSSQRTILSGALRLNNAYVAGAVVGTGYVTIQDSTGTTYRVPVLV